MKIKIVSCTLGALSCAGSIIAQETKPNIILIFTDDLGYGDVGVFFQNKLALLNNGKLPHTFTPQLDKLAGEGVQMTNHYCAAPVSAPSRSSLLTGLSQGHCNVRDNQFDKELANNHTLGTVLKSAGYATSAFGKWGVQGKTDNSPNWPAHPNKRGFDYFYGYIRHKDGHEHYPKEGIYDGPKEVYENYKEVSGGLDKCYTADLWTAAAKKWIVEQATSTNEKKPFFVYLAYDTPHAVLELPTQPYPEGGGLTGGIQWLGAPGKMINTASGVVDSWIHPDYANATYDNDDNSETCDVAWPDVYRRYATSTRRIDDAVGDILKLLRDLKIDNNTLVVFTSDNGPSAESYLKADFSPDFFKGYGPFDGIKRDCMEGGVRVPALAWWPGTIPAATIIETPSINYDWMATFLEIAKVPAPAKTDGVSLLPSLTGKGIQQEGLVYVEYFEKGNTPNYSDFFDKNKGKKRNQMQMIRFGDLVGVRYNVKSHTDNFEIYNIKTDPGEENNLASNIEMAAVQQMMKDKVLQSRRPDKSAPRPYDKELIPAVDSKKTAKGISWKAFEGEFNYVPDLSLLAAIKSGTKKDFSKNFMSKKWKGALLIEGFINVPKDGEYTFYMTADAGAILKVHNCTLIDEDFGYQKGTEKSATMLLKAGLHPIKINLLINSDKPIFNLEWSSVDFMKQQLKSTNLSHTFKK